MLKTSLLVTAGLLATIAWYACPIYKPFPNPTGQYTVGTTVTEFTDPSRKELYSENPDEQRTLVVRFFYPSSEKVINGPPTNENLEKYPYLGAKMPYYQQHIASQYHLPHAAAKLLLRNITTHSFINAPVSNAQNSYPVILFSHGLLGYPSDTHLTILEDLASHGYIVAAIDHPYFNGLTLYANGTILTEKKLSNQFNAMSQTEQKKFLSQAIEIYQADMKLVIDELQKLNQDQNSIFYHHTNLDLIAAMGHSAGGTASIEFCRTDNRCKAAIDLDGWYDHVIGHEPINKPLLLIFAQKSIEVTEPAPEYLKRKELTREGYYEREKNIEEHKKALCNTPNCSMIILEGISHGDFGDMMFIKWPLRGWNEVEPYTTLKTINDHILKFFDTYLKK